MIDILRLKQFFPLKNFEDVENLFEYNIDRQNGEPNLTLLSIVAGLIEHSLVVVSDKDDLVANSRSVEQRRDIYQNKPLSKILPSSNSGPTATTSNHQHILSSTSNENCQLTHSQTHRPLMPDDSDHNEAAYFSSEKPSLQLPDSSILQHDHDHDFDHSDEYTAIDNLMIPEIEFEIVETLYKKFVDQLKSSINFMDIDSSKVNLKIKKISDCVWGHLSNSYYKDKPHLQNIFSYLTTNKLDCFGLAFAVIAGCQIFNIKNIYLALSEDHAWVMFDDDQDREKQIRSYTDNLSPIPSCALHGTCEVTWHGKANSDKRGLPVTYRNCWLYTNGYAVKCDITSCVVALVNSINPTINTNTDSEILALLQQRLLWMLYNKGLYITMALNNLGELENICPTPRAPLNPIELFHLSIEISRSEYNDSHVYPYTYLASHFFRHGRFKEALQTWAHASAVMTKYNYSRDDEEIYKEFFEVANELIPSMLKVLTAGGLEPGRVSQKPFLQDPECFALILKFYDNICVWEEGSSTPVLHIGWAKNFVATVLKFSSFIRSKTKPLTEEEWINLKNQVHEEQVVSSRTESQQCSSSVVNEIVSDSRIDNLTTRPIGNSDEIDDSSKTHNDTKTFRSDDLKSDHRSCDLSSKINRSKRIKLGAQDPSVNQIRSQAIDDRVDTSESSDSSNPKNQKSNPGCSRTSGHISNSRDTDRKQDKISLDQSDHTIDSGRNIVKNADKAVKDGRLNLESMDTSSWLEVDGDKVAILLNSSKIAGVRDLLHAERLNKTAIELQLTAQSQCAVRGRSNSNSYSDFVPTSAFIGSTRSKRLQR